MSYKAKPGRSITVYGSLPEINKAIDAFNNDWLELHNSDEDLILYHYTTNNGLKGILQNCSIWFSHINYFIDPQEWRYGQEIVVTQLKKVREQESEKSIIKLLEDIQGAIEGYTKVLFNIFIACFCKEDDLLSQWREYAANGGGYSLGISFDDDTKYSHYINDLSTESHPILRKVIYDPDLQTNFVGRFLKIIINAAKKECEISGKTLSEIGGPVTLEATNTLSEIIPCIKHPAFEKEEEWRLIQNLRPDHKVELLEFRERKGELIPYIETYIYRDDTNPVFPIKSLRYGPSLDDERSKLSLQLLKNSCAKSASPINIIKENVEILGSGYVLRG